MDQDKIYYDGTKLLSMLDINGKTPEIYLCTSNRTAGKTTYFARLLINRFKKSGKKFVVLYRFNYELDDVADKFFKDVHELFFPADVLTSKSKAHGIYHELFLNNVSCGYALSLNAADQIKRYSHLFSDSDSIFFDEFQSENNHYCDHEIRKFQSIHTSLARGKGKQTRYLPVYMCSNTVSILNPYYTALGIAQRLNKTTKFLRGNGWILEQGHNEHAAKALIDSGFNKAFSDADNYTDYAAQGVYLNDNHAFIEKPVGTGRYLATLKYKNKEYGIREYAQAGVIYCDNHPDITFNYKISVTTDDHAINYVMLRRNDLFLSQMRYYFEKGAFRFKDLACKEAILKSLSY